MAKLIRTFIGVDIFFNPELKALVKCLRKELDEEKYINWFSNKNLHLILKFIGDTNPININNIKRIVRNIVGQFSVFSVDIMGLDYFKKRELPSILFFKVEKYDLLEKMAEKIDAELFQMGVKRERRLYKPHLTIAKIKKLYDIDRFYSIFKQSNMDVKQSVDVNRVIFYKSILSPKGAVYEPIEVFKIDKK